MPAQEIYLDNSATTRPLPQVVETMVATLQDEYGNPSSLHRKGLAAERRLKRARMAVAALLEVAPETITFTSGATESNNLAIRGSAHALERWGNHIVTSSIEHSSVLATCEALEDEGFEVSRVPVTGEGLITVDAVERAIRPETTVVSLMFVNNEVGSVQPVAQVGALARRLRAQGQHIQFHVDAVQAVGKVQVSPELQGIDLLSMSAHKFRGPKGVGALYRHPDTRLRPILTGGDQEEAVRPGTENVPGIVGMGVAAEYLASHWRRDADYMRKLRDSLVEKVMTRIDGVKRNGPTDPTHSAPHIANFSFLDIRAEVLIHYLEAEGIYVSTGSACHSRTRAPSHVLVALGLNQAQLDGAIRISLSPDNTREELEVFVDALETALPELRRIVRRS